MFAPRFSAVWLIVLAVLALAFTSSRASGGSPAAETRYVVQRGDTLWAIAAVRYDGDPRGAVWRLQERNGLTGASLEPGMILYLPP